MPFVLDCSVTMAWILPDEAVAGTVALRDSLVENTAVVPGLWPIEVANVLLVATRRGRIKEEIWPDLLERLAALPIETDPEIGTRAFTDSLRVARDQRLSVYDAAYLELAMRRRIPLATLGRELGAAARDAGVRVLP